ncbi:S8 family serine peptidase [Metaclostridioides mangenotii]|uniref:S8 family serine peptidase n=1 Tax=Metaclostridioides mangenotii TaxID=1540 RepID=UPI0026F289BB|nr:S8 family serine peptidase [Clostridioides mangenotii]
MRKIKVAILDTGIDLNDSYLNSNCCGKKNFLLDSLSGEIIVNEEVQDENGHGSACAYTILNYSNNTEILPIKILDNSGKTYSKCLLLALKYLIYSDVKLINISLATTNFSYKDEFFNICEELVERGKIIIASQDNKLNESLPSILPNVIGVRGARFKDSENYWYNSNAKIQCISDNEPMFIKVGKGECLKFGRNSKSAALMTANISNLLSKSCEMMNFEQVDRVLNSNANRNVWDEYDLN